MLCQSCHKAIATTTIKSIVNGELTEYALCPECAKKLGYTNFFGDFAEGLGSLLGGFFGGDPVTAPVVRCKKCGATFDEIARSGKVGCAECYKTFLDRLLPSIQRIHGTAHHRGKRPGTLAMQVVKKPEIVAQPVPTTPLEEKKAALKKAIAEQNFEEAAVLRDQIREMEGEK